MGQVNVQQETVELRHGDVLLGAGGIAVAYPGMAEVWVRLEPTGHEWPTSVGRQAKRALETWIEAYKPRRVQASVVAENEPARRLVEWLGFAYESTMPLYGPNGETCIRYVLFPHHQEQEEKRNDG